MGMEADIESRNWAGNVVYRAAQVHRPESVAQVQEIVRGATQVKALGTRHSFNRVADTDGDHISLAGLNTVTALDLAQRTVTVEAGMRYGELSRFLDTQGLALHNLASLPHISVAGAVATGTHGSGIANASLSAAVRALELVTADGELTTFTRGDNDFPGVVVGLGELGVIARVTLDIEPTYTIAQTAYERLTLPTLAQSFNDLMGSAYSVSLFTDWRGGPGATFALWRKAREEDAAFDPKAFGMVLADGPRHPIPGLSAENCTEQGGKPGPWYERLPHFRLEFTPSAGDELQAEYLIPRDHAVSALQTIASLSEQIVPLLMVCEIRTVAADNLWLSPSTGHDSVALHFTWKPEGPAVHAFLPTLEAALAPYNARPHWGKLYTHSPETLASLYPNYANFQALRHRLDPRGKFKS